MILKRFYTCLFIALLVPVLVSCQNKTGTSEDVLSQKIGAEDKIQVTVLVKNAFTINTFEKAVEEKFPNLDIIQVGNHTRDMGIAEYAARLEHDDLTDIVMTWPLDVGEEYWDDRLMDLSSLPLSSKYNTAMLNSISRDGKLHYLPGPSQVRGIMYNKTLFAENGWSVPNDFEGFIELCQTIEKSGIRSLQLGLGNEEVLDTAFVGYSNASCFSKPSDAQWISDYNDGKGNFADHFMPALETFQTLIDAGILKKEDLGLYYQDRERMLFTRQCAMIEDSVLMARIGSDRGSTDTFGLMPFFNPGEDSDWARLYPVCFIGVNKKLADSREKEKYNLVMEVLEYISTTEGQIALSGDTGAVFSALNGMAPPDVPEIDELIQALSYGRYTVFPTLKNAQNALRKGLAGMVEGTMTAEDVAKMVDKENLSPAEAAVPPVLGRAEKDFSWTDTGNFITDVLRAESGCEIALFLDNGKDGTQNGKGVSARLYQGDVTPVDIKRILPDLKYGEKGELWKVTMTGADLLTTLEYSIPVGNNQTGWFYYFSGLQIEFAPAAQPGRRIRKITDEKGNDINPDKIYSIAVADDTVPADFLKSCEKTGIIILDLLGEAVQEQGTIAPAQDNRFVVCEP